MDVEIQTALHEQGADIVRFVDISHLPSEQTQGFTKAIIFTIPLSKEFISGVYNNVPIQNDEYLEKDEKVNNLAEWLAGFIQEKGYAAYAQSEKNNMHSGYYDNATRTSNLPHKTIARLAGLGFIGKNNLLISEEYGCAFCMCTVLTDAPITTENYPLSTTKCGSCEACKKVCPGKAIKGYEWTENGGRDSIIDVFKCCCPLKCMIYCPWTLKYAGLRRTA